MRTDIHRPSAEEFDPQGYDYVTCFDLRPGTGLDPVSAALAIQAERDAREKTIKSLQGQGYDFRNNDNGLGNCTHCGAWIRYAALMTHEPSKGLIWVGETCLENRFSLTKSEFKTLRENASLNKDRSKLSVRAAGIIDAFSPEVRTAYDWAISFKDTDPFGSCDWEELTREQQQYIRSAAYRNHSFAYDIAHKVTLKGWELSEKQQALLVKVMNEYNEREAKRAEENRKVEAGEVAGCPEGRVVITGEIVSLKSVETDFGTTLKMLVKAESGFKVWGTVPSSLWPEVGNKVKFTGTCQPSNDDKTFGFFSRPAKAQILEA